MKKKTIIGLMFVSLAIVYPVTLASGRTLYIDLIPDFIGFLLIRLGMDKMSYYNRYLRDAANFATGCLVLSFMTLVGQLSPLFITYLQNSSVGSGMAAVAVVVTLFEQMALYVNFFLDAIYMIFIAYFCYGTASELHKRILTAEDRRERAWKGPYGDMMYSRRAYAAGERLSKVFCVVYALIAAAYAVNQIYAYVLPADGGMQGIVFSVLGFDIGLWALFLPVNILYIIYANEIVPMIAGPRIEPDPYS